MSACLQYKDEEALKTTIMERKANKCCLCSAMTETFADMENHIVTLHPDIFRGTPVKPIAKHPDEVEKKTKICRPDHSGAKSLKREGPPSKQLQTLIIYFNCSDTMTYFFQQSKLTWKQSWKLFFTYLQQLPATSVRNARKPTTAMWPFRFTFNANTTCIALNASPALGTITALGPTSAGPSMSSSSFRISSCRAQVCDNLTSLAYSLCQKKTLMILILTDPRVII